MSTKGDASPQASVESHDLAGRTLRGLRWSYFSIFFNALVQIGFAAVMARLLPPSAFGVVAMAGVVLRYGLQFSQLGVGQALVQRRVLSRDDVRAAFTASVGLGVLFMAVFWALAPLAGDLFHDPDVVWATRALSAGFVLAGLATTPTSLLRRDLAFRPIALIEIGAYVAGYGLVGVGLAVAGAGYWALVAGTLAQQALTAVLLLSVRRFPLRPLIAWSRLRSLYSFGAKITVISVLEITAGSLATFWIGSTMSATAVGLFTRASYLISLPSQYVTSGLSRVLMPSFSRLQAERGRLRRAYMTSIAVIAAVMLPLGWGTAGAAPQVVAVVLGDQWASAAPILALLALAAPFSMLSHFAGIVCEATATLNAKLALSGLRLAVLAGLFWMLAAYGLPGLAGALLLEELLTQAGYVFITHRIVGVSVAALLRTYRPGFFSGVCAGAATWTIARAGGRLDLPAWLLLGLQLLAGGGIMTAFVWWSDGGTLRRELQVRRRQLRGRDPEPDQARGAAPSPSSDSDRPVG